MPAGWLPQEREAIITTYLQLRPVALAHLRATVPADLRAEFEAVTPRQLQALSLIPEEGVTMHELAARLGISAPTTSTLADRLVSQGLALREPSSTDRRVVRVIKTPKGCALAVRYAEMERQVTSEMFARLSEVQVRALVDVVRTLAATPDSPIGHLSTRTAQPRPHEVWA
jgi:DNA-binding MarR family transcriptional regulator